jgi:cytochrome c oxidase subunit 2
MIRLITSNVYKILAMARSLLACHRFLLFAFIFMSQYASAENSVFNMRPGVTDISREVYSLHMLVFLICCVIAVAVFGVMFWALIYHRKSKGAKAALFHESTKVEVIWTLIPMLILIGMAIPATKTLLSMENPSESELTVLVTGSQWKWHYRYPDHDIGFFSRLSTPQEEIKNTQEKSEHYLLDVDNALVIPTGKKVRFLVTSDDVIHSWWVPDFAVKKDAIPGFINEAWANVNEPGTYRGQCAELCGNLHAFMPIVVNAVSPEDFDAWLETKREEAEDLAQAEAAALGQDMGMEELMELGEKVYLTSCAACHQVEGQGIPGVFPPMVGSPIALGDVNAHIDIIVNGKAGTAMQSFAKQLTASEIAAVVTYERNAFTNNTGDLVQASQVDTVLQRAK